VIGLSLISLSACSSAPTVDTCVSDPGAGGMQCTGKGDDTGYFRPYEDSEGFVCASHSDLKRLADYIQRQAGKSVIKLKYLTGF